MFYLGMIIFYNDKIVIGILELEISMVVYFYSFADLQKPLQKNFIWHRYVTGYRQHFKLKSHLILVKFYFVLEQF